MRILGIVSQCVQVGFYVPCKCPREAGWAAEGAAVTGPWLSQGTERRPAGWRHRVWPLRPLLVPLRFVWDFSLFSVVFMVTLSV